MKIPSIAGWGSRRTLLIVGAVAVVCLAIAMPRLFGSFHDADPDQHPVDPTPFVPPAAVDPSAAVDLSLLHSRYPAGYVPPSTGQAAEDEPPAVAAPTVATSKDGDLAVALKLRWTEYETGDRILAKLRLSNHSLSPVFLPAAGEPDAGLAIVVEDEKGAEVRRVVETGRDRQLPRRMLKLASGAEAEIPVVVVAAEDAPLPPGRYSVHAEMRADPLLVRTGLPLWAAPNGSIRSDAVPLVVTPKAK